MALPVFKTGGADELGSAGSIPVRLRQLTPWRSVIELDPRRSLPRVDDLLADPAVQESGAGLRDGLIRTVVREAVADARAGNLEPADLIDVIRARMPRRSGSLRPVLNATGVVVHTNLGRAPLSDPAREAMVAAAGYTSVELDLATGQRSARGEHVLVALRRAVPEAEAALVVNNGAAALVLATTALAADGEILVSRGELVEIGDGFRLPELISSCGARIREVGTTNRTRLADYAEAIGPQTRAILKVHPSNFRIEGFVGSVDTPELATLGVPVIHDVGSGLLAPHPLLPDEPDVRSALAAGASLVTASGDKLLGGPQAGLLLGRADLITRLRRHPLARALRVDKTTLAALEATLTAATTPVAQMLTADPDRLHARCAALVNTVGIGSVVAVEGVVGGGGAPGVRLPGWAVHLPPPYAAALRCGDPPVLARIDRGACLVDVRCIPDSSDDDLAAALHDARQAVEGTSG